MAKYIFIRLLLFLPTLLVISLVIFLISKASPGDPALERLENQLSKSGMGEYQASAEMLQASRAKLSLDKPEFYFELSMQSSPDSLYKIPFEREKQMLKRISYISGQADLSRKYYEDLKSLPPSKYKYELLAEAKIPQALEILESMPFNPLKNDLKSTLIELSKQKTIFNYLPKVEFHGLDNQYHLWLSKLLQWEFGKSYTDNQQVSTKIASALKLTLGLSLAALFLAYFISILLVLMSMYFENGFFASLLSNFFLILYSLPVFIVASFLLIFFGSSDYFQWFPVFGIGPSADGMGFWELIWVRIEHLFLPLLCLTYVSIAFLYQQLYNNISLNLKKDYIRVAKAKGLSRMSIVGKHAFRNSMTPLIAHLANIFPGIVGGSFVVEFIFSLPGMGMLTLDSIFSRDYPSIYAILLLVSSVGLLGALLSDILLAIFDPRVSFAESTNSENEN